ncbi:MAG: DUF3575 domain-containing protein [Coprobacter sp.]|nr:DUF3575 domain-containing protein [Coprobacter sp.]
MILLFAISASAVDIPDSSAVLTSRIYYPVNKISIYENYMGNSAQLSSIKKYLHDSFRSVGVDSIVIYSYASPEGPYSFNAWLARERGKTAKRYLLRNIPDYALFSDSQIVLAPLAENWPGLREEIEAHYTRPDRDTVLSIIDMDSISDESRKAMLKRLDSGKTWRYILRNIMPRLRYATWVCVARHDVTPSAILPFPVEFPPIEYPVLAPMTFIAPIHRDTKTILALKTNLLYDALMWQNFSIEVPFAGDKFSVLYYHQFPWWRWGEEDNEYCNRFLSIGAEGRWWFAPQPRPAEGRRKKRDRLVGHFLGVYCESGKYDFEWKRDICHQGEFWSAGLSYGYSMPVGRRLNLEFSISAGYASIAHRGYNPSPDYSILWKDHDKQGRWHYFGPTKAQISLVIPIMMRVKKGGGS